MHTKSTWKATTRRLVFLLIANVGDDHPSLQIRRSRCSNQKPWPSIVNDAANKPRGRCDRASSRDRWSTLLIGGRRAATTTRFCESTLFCAAATCRCAQQRRLTDGGKGGDQTTGRAGGRASVDGRRACDTRVLMSNARAHSIGCESASGVNRFCCHHHSRPFDRHRFVATTAMRRRANARRDLAVFWRRASGD